MVYYTEAASDVCVIMLPIVVKSQMAEAIDVWEDEGGSAPRKAEHRMTGTVNQIDWAEQIRVKVDAEFDRVRKALESVASRQSAGNGAYLQAIVRILEDKREEVMGNEQAGYFIHDWQELKDQVRRLIGADPRYKAIKADQARTMAERPSKSSRRNQ